MSEELKLLTFKQVEAKTGLSRSEIYRQIKAGTFPKPVRIGKRAKRFFAHEVDEHLKGLGRVG